MGWTGLGDMPHAQKRRGRELRSQCLLLFKLQREYEVVLKFSHGVEMEYQLNLIFSHDIFVLCVSLDQSWRYKEVAKMMERLQLLQSVSLNTLWYPVHMWPWCRS